MKLRTLHEHKKNKQENVPQRHAPRYTTDSEHMVPVLHEADMLHLRLWAKGVVTAGRAQVATQCVRKGAGGNVNSRSHSLQRVANSQGTARGGLT